MKLYSYYRSTAAYRIRIALHYKNLNHEIIPVNLLQREQWSESFQQLNPHARVPTLIDDSLTMGQSLAMLEYLQEKYPQPALLPDSIAERAQIRYFSQIIACDMHPLNNVSVLNYLKSDMGHNAAEVNTWYHHWLKLGFDALETLITNQQSQGPFCFGDKMSFADVCLIPQIYNADRFKFSLAAYPHLLAINEHCLSLSCFEQAQPENQVDYAD